MSKKEVCQFALEDGKEIVVEREIYKVILDEDAVTFVVSYYVNGKNYIPFIEELLNDVLDLRLESYNNIFKPDNPDYLDYEIIVNANDLDSLKAKINEIDNTVISKIKWIIEQANKINKIIANIQILPLYEVVKRWWEISKN